MTNNNTKRALLGSALALILCFAMLMGTTFAWFTDSASTQVSTVKSGTLDVELQVMEDNGWVSAEGKTLNFRAADGREEILWEPGATYELPELRVRNNGNLALKLKLVMNGIGGDAELNDAIVWEMKPERYDGWLALDSSKLSLEDLVLLPDGVEEAGYSNTVTFIIRGHMKEEAGNEYQNKTIEGAAITVLATQFTHESDSEDNLYDEDATYGAVVSNLTEINTAITGGQSALVIDKDITVDVNQNDSWSVIRVDKENGAADEVTLTGNGTVTSNKFVIWARNGAKVIVKSGNYVTTGSTHMVYANLGGTVVIEGGTFKAPTEGEHLFNVANAAPYSTIIIKGGLYSRNPSTQIPGNDAWSDEKGWGIRIENGYKVVEKDIDGTTWYEVVPE